MSTRGSCLDSFVGLAVLSLVVAVVIPFSSAWAQSSFVNFETPPVHPIDLSPDGLTLAVTNTPDNRIELFDLSGDLPESIGAISVGLNPVSVRFLGDDEVWVVNHISDSVSVVDLRLGLVRATLETLDEPFDLVFAGDPQRAFVSCSQANTILVFDPENLAGAPRRISIDAEDPRALAVSPDGMRVYAAIFESGNETTILAGSFTSNRGIELNAVDNPRGPYGGENPPPNDGDRFNPPQRSGNPTPPHVGLIVRRRATGQWIDDNNADWTALVSGGDAALSGRVPGWRLLDRDIAVINAGSLSVSYVGGLMNLCMALAVNPVTGVVSVVGTDATNDIRFEPNVQSTFVRVHLSMVDSLSLRGTTFDINPHLSYASPRVSQNVRDLSIGDPRGIAWTQDGSKAFVSGMGSNNLVVVDASGQRLSAPIEVGQGPMGLVIDDARSRLYVLNNFDASLSIVDTIGEFEIAQVKFFDPTPRSVRRGRKHFYDTHRNSGLGQAACASCHADGTMDRLAWDLGDPSGTPKSPQGQNLGFGIDDGPFDDFHPMKGPMMTQTLIGIVGHEPFHWRGDRDGIEEFGGAFVSLLGRDSPLSGSEMQDFEDFLETIHFPPNPFRNLDNSLPTSLPLPGHLRAARFGRLNQALPNGNAVRGLRLYRGQVRTLDGSINCVTCHTLPAGDGTDTVWRGGTRFDPIPLGPNGEHHVALFSGDGLTQRGFKIPQLRNMYDKVGFETTISTSRAGFGFLHDGSVPSLSRFMSSFVFDVESDQEVADLVALQLAFTGSDFGPPPSSAGSVPEPPGLPNADVHAAVGKQVTVRGDNPSLLGSFVSIANGGEVDLIAKGVVDGFPRGWRYDGATIFQSDKAGETISLSALTGLSSEGNEITFTVVPLRSGTRIGIDRDLDGIFDFDEIEQGSPPDGGEGEGEGEGEGGDDGGGGTGGEGEGEDDDPPGPPPEPPRAQIEVVPSVLDFGAVSMSRAELRRVTVTNVGDSQLRGEATATFPFEILDESAYNLAPGTSEVVTIRFRPPSVARFQMTVLFTGGGDARVVAVGRGLDTSAPDPRDEPDPDPFMVSPAALDFGQVPLPFTNDRLLTVENNSLFIVDGEASISAPYKIVSGGSYRLAPGEHATVVVRFEPPALGQFLDEVLVTGLEERRIPVIGTGVEALASEGEGEGEGGAEGEGEGEGEGGAEGEGEGEGEGGAEGEGEGEQGTGSSCASAYLGPDALPASPITGDSLLLLATFAALLVSARRRRYGDRR